MPKKKILTILIGVILILFVFMYLYYSSFTSEYIPNNGEIALHIKLNTDEDIGLIVYDYEINNHKYSGGISNADASLINKTSDNIVILRKNELNTSLDSFNIDMQIRIITEYVSPNFENIYDEDITRYTNSILINSAFGNSYYIDIIGNKENGYTAILED